ncbi:MAG TPA: hypothetical protein VFK57_06495 [Vicinamibacterales bacterium]|nr:hypothetical protein [Vicinamibacterales bacterium]
MKAFLSSIFSSEALRGVAWRVPAGAVGAIAIVGGCELFLHAGSRWLPDPVLWGSNEVSAKVEQVRRMAAAGRAPVDVLILGPSHASVGLSPKEMAAAGPLRIYNGALNGRTYPALEFVFRHVYEPLLKPRTLVLAVSPLVLNAHNRWMERNSAQLFASPYPTALQASGPIRPLRRFLVDHVGLYRYRHRQQGLRDGRIDGRRRLDEFGFVGAATAVYRAAPDGLPRDHPYRQIMHAYDFSGPSVDAFVRLLSWGREANVPIVVVNMPFRGAMLDISATGRADYERYLAAMAGLRREFGFRWLDYEGGLTLADAEFRDVDHLNAAGVARVSRQLGQDLGLLVAEAAR